MVLFLNILKQWKTAFCQQNSDTDIPLFPKVVRRFMDSSDRACHKENPQLVPDPICMESAFQVYEEEIEKLFTFLWTTARSAIQLDS